MIELATATKKKTSKVKKNLVIVESPAKAKTIEKYLGRNYRVVASVGHVRDLKKSSMSIDFENNYAPQYINIRGKGPLINDLKKEAKKAKKVYLASDPDREGEAISWHLAHILNLDENEENRGCPAGSPCLGPLGGVFDFPYPLEKGQERSVSWTGAIRCPQAHHRP